MRQSDAVAHFVGVGSSLLAPWRLPGGTVALGVHRAVVAASPGAAVQIVATTSVDRGLAPAPAFSPPAELAVPWVLSFRTKAESGLPASVSASAAFKA